VRANRKVTKGEAQKTTAPRKQKNSEEGCCVEVNQFLSFKQQRNLPCKNKHQTRETNPRGSFASIFDGHQIRPFDSE
jgi:hypothetical protein